MSSASAKIILFGEHSVVYGEPAIAVPVSSLRAYADIQPAEQFQIVARDLNDKVITFDGDDPLAHVSRLILDVLNIPAPDISINIHSDIPIASGLGSGAAISTVVIRALAHFFNRAISLNVINEIVYEVEKIHHGTPSGIDNTVIVYEQPVYFVREHPIEMVDVGEPMQIVVADTGMAALTKHSVGDVRRLYEERPAITKPIIDKMGILAQTAKSAMKTGDLQTLGILMLQNHMLLRQLTVSSDQLDILVDTAMLAGALGAKLSGGGRGGNMIALVTENTIDAVMKALTDAGAKRVFKTIVEAH